MPNFLAPHPSCNPQTVGCITLWSSSALSITLSVDWLFFLQQLWLSSRDMLNPLLEPSVFAVICRFPGCWSYLIAWKSPKTSSAFVRLKISSNLSFTEYIKIFMPIRPGNLAEWSKALELGYFCFNPVLRGVSSNLTVVIQIFFWYGKLFFCRKSV